MAKLFKLMALVLLALGLYGSAMAASGARLMKRWRWSAKLPTI
jgi:hypothetical protein